jgi:hypothetical protein
MTNQYGMLSLADSDRVFIDTVGQIVTFNAVNTYLMQRENELRSRMAVFVQPPATWAHKWRYKLPGGGKLQRRGQSAQVGATKAYGEWDVALPIVDWGDQKAFDDVTYALLTVGEFERQMADAMMKDLNTMRDEMWRPIFNNVQQSFVDREYKYGTLAIEPLANGDTVVYPPILGTDSEAIQNNYSGTSYASSAVSDTNNPIPAIVVRLQGFFGESQGGSNIAVYVKTGSTLSTKLQSLTAFVEYRDRYVSPGIQANYLTETDIPASVLTGPGIVIGRMNGAWIIEYQWIPEDYLVGVHLDAEKPLMMRVDEPVVAQRLARFGGDGTGFYLAATDYEYPIESAHYRRRVGFGAVNRLNGVVVYVGGTSAYAIPAAYA